ncbi:MAG: hypothetical protein QGF12_00150 [SAR202 cluster bacterium]|nr:hypothetical protein [SAR202 cluster bacterium]
MKILVATAIFAVLLGVIACNEPAADPITTPFTPIPQPTLIPEPTITAKSTPIPAENSTPSPTPEPPDLLFRYMYAVNLLNAAQYEEAIPQFDLVIRMLPDLALAYNYRARAHYKRDVPNLGLARSDLDKAIELDPNFAEAYRNRGVLKLNEGDEESGVIDLQKAFVLYIDRGDVVKAALIKTTIEQQRAPSP